MNREVGYLSHMSVDASYLLISEDGQQVKSHDAMMKHFVKYKVYPEVRTRGNMVRNHRTLRTNPEGTLEVVDFRPPLYTWQER